MIVLNIALMLTVVVAIVSLLAWAIPRRSSPA